MSASVASGVDFCKGLGFRVLASRLHKIEVKPLNQAAAARTRHEKDLNSNLCPFLDHGLNLDFYRLWLKGLRCAVWGSAGLESLRLEFGGSRVSSVQGFAVSGLRGLRVYGSGSMGHFRV